MTDALDHLHHTRQVYDMTVLGRALARATNEPAARDLLHLGTAAIWDVPETGDASTSQVVIGTDSRLTDARTPTAHTHATSDILGLSYFATGTDAANLTGTLADARLSSNVALRNADNAFSVAQTIAGSAPSSVSAGQVAIGGGLIRLENADDASIYLTETSGATLRIRAGGSSGNIVASTGKNLDLCSNDELHARLKSGGAAIFYGTAPSSVSAGQVAIGGGELWVRGSCYLVQAAGLCQIDGGNPESYVSGAVRMGGGYIWAHQKIYAGGGAYGWTLSGYTATAPSATGYVTITINGTTYKLLAST